ncbi:uncharacterized protein DS421_9g267370 [Arachis hypogaea]|nr:uncharacterized protein DS421_9g267370 [Arachis hypogaea]
MELKIEISRKVVYRLTSELAEEKNTRRRAEEQLQEANVTRSKGSSLSLLFMAVEKEKGEADGWWRWRWCWCW